MALNDIQQLKKIIEDSRYILILVNAKENGDALAAALALKSFLKKLHRDIDIVCPDFTVPKQLSFLPGIHEIKPALAHLQKFIIKVDVSKTPVDSISYDIKDGTLQIYLTPKQGVLSKNELRTARSTFKYDLIITLNTPDLQSLGTVFSSNSELFFHSSIANIDFLPSNERYGQINIVDLTASSVSEITYRLIREFGEKYLDQMIATSILTGMTIATKSFKNPNLSPTTLQIASNLIASGAEREKIAGHLYRTRSIETLRLWGEALTRLENNPSLGLVWTSLTREDFTRSGATAENLTGIIDELISNSPDAKIILILYEVENGAKKISGFLSAEKNFDAMKLVSSLGPEGNRRLAHFSLDITNLKEAEEKVLKIIKNNLG